MPFPFFLLPGSSVAVVLGQCSVSVYIGVILSGAKQILIIVWHLHSSEVSVDLADVLKREVNKDELNPSERSGRAAGLHLC